MYFALLRLNKYYKLEWKAEEMYSYVSFIDTVFRANGIITLFLNCSRCGGMLHHTHKHITALPDIWLFICMLFYVWKDFYHMILQLQSVMK